MNKSYLLLITCLILTGCNKTKVETDDSYLLKQLNSKKRDSLAIGEIRIQALRDTALSLGARGGLATRAAQINEILLKYEPLLQRIYNFNGMLLDDNVMPPVLIEARKTLSLSGDDVIRVADRNYQILKQAKFVTASPSWRDYLWLTYPQPEQPDRSLLPRSSEEQPIWSKYIDEGWEAGINQAELIFKENVNRLKRDFNGMIRYRKLLAQNMVSPPFVASLDMGITGDSSNLTVNDRVLRITAFPEMQLDSGQWKTEIREYE